MKFEIQLQGAGGSVRHTVELTGNGAERRILLDGKEVAADGVTVSPNSVSVLLGGQSFEIHVAPGLDGKVKLQCGPHEYAAEIMDPRAWRGRKQGALESEGRQPVSAPMPGKVIRVLVETGQSVEAGQGLLIVEAMKMQNEIRSPKSGKVERLLATEGQKVNAGDVLVWVE